MRLFFAIALPTPVADALASTVAKLAHTRADVKWVAASNFHITVKFLGETDEGLLPELSARLDRAAAQVNAFDLEIEGIDRLPERGPVRVIMSRVINPDNRLTKLHRLIDSAVGGIGLPMDMRALVPHVTLGRVSSNHGLNKLLRLVEKHDVDFFGKFTVSHVSLVASTLTPAGSVYRVVHTSELALPQVAVQPAHRG